MYWQSNSGCTMWNKLQADYWQLICALPWVCASDTFIIIHYTLHVFNASIQMDYIYIWLPIIPNLEEFIPTLLIWYLYTRLECILHGIMTSDTILWPYISSRWCISLLFYFCQQCKQESWWNHNQVGKEDEIYMLIWTTASWRMKLVYCQSSCISHN